MRRWRTLAALAAQYNKTVEELLEVLRRRSVYRRARLDRRRSHTRFSRLRGRRARPGYSLADHGVYVGEGELHPLIRMAGMTEAEFCAFAGISKDTFRRWYGHPLHRMPIELLRYRIAFDKAVEAGINMDAFLPEIEKKKMPRGQYPRGSTNVPVIDPGEESVWKK